MARAIWIGLVAATLMACGAAGAVDDEGDVAANEAAVNAAAVAIRDARVVGHYRALLARTRPELRDALRSVPAAFMRRYCAPNASLPGDYRVALELEVTRALQAGGLPAQSGADLGALTFVAAIDTIVTLDSLSKSLSTQDEMDMIKLQSAIAARGQLLQMVSNMIAAFNATASSIVGNVR